MIDVTCAIVIKEGKVLCAKRGPSMSMAGKWEFPGGKLEEGETLEACLVREIHEELGYTIEVKKALIPNKWEYESGPSICLYPFICTIISGSEVLLEHEVVSWLTFEKLHTLDWAAADIPIVNQILPEGAPPYWCNEFV